MLHKDGQKEINTRAISLATRLVWLVINAIIMNGVKRPKPSEYHCFTAQPWEEMALRHNFSRASH